MPLSLASGKTIMVAMDAKMKEYSKKNAKIKSKTNWKMVKSFIKDKGASALHW
jgi:hypothetical protein